MGVMPCSRKDCPNIMCDTYINGHGYICNDCLEELKKIVSTNRYKESELNKIITDFFNSEKQEKEREMSLEDLISWKI